MVNLWVQNGHPVFIGWNEMTLLGHLAWGRLLALMGLTSIAARQWGTAVQAVFTVLLMAWLVRYLRPDLSRLVAALAALSWLANPITLLSATSFMTEVPTTLWVVATLAAFARWEMSDRSGWIVVSAMTAVAAFSVRQTSVVLPVALAAASLFLTSRRRRIVGLVTELIVISLDGALWLYRSSLPLATIRSTRSLIVDGTATRIALSAGLHTVQALVLCSLLMLPLVLLTPSRSGRRLATGAALGILATALLAIKHSTFPFWGNILTPHGILPDLLPPSGPYPVAIGPVEAWTATILGAVAMGIVVSSGCWRHLTRTVAGRALVLAGGGHLAAMAVAALPFDRYVVPVLALGILIVATAFPSSPSKPAGIVSAAVLGLLVVLSAAAAQHFNHRQQSVWRLATEVARQHAIPAERLDGGFEWNMWNQPVPFHPDEAHDSGSVPVWYEAYPFTRMDPEVRLWIGPPPPGWKVSERHAISDGLQISVLVPQ